MTEETDASQPEMPQMSDLDAQQAAEIEAAMQEARARLLTVPPETVVVNHVMGLYELAAIHLSNTPPNLGGAKLAIDSMALLVDGLGDRLGPDAPTMVDALGNIRMAFVSVSNAVSNAATSGDETPEARNGDAGIDPSASGSSASGSSASGAADDDGADQDND